MILLFAGRDLSQADCHILAGRQLYRKGAPEYTGCMNCHIPCVDDIGSEVCCVINMKCT